MKSKVLLVLTAVLITGLLFNCGDTLFNDDNNSDETSNMSLYISRAPSGVNTAMAYVTGSDFDTITSALTVSDNTITGLITGLPVGTNRTLIVETLNSSNIVTYKGTKEGITITANTTAPVSIVLYPVTGSIDVNGTFADTQVILYDPLKGTDVTATTFISSYGGSTYHDIAYETITINSREVLAVKFDTSHDTHRYIMYTLPSTDVQTIEFWWKSPTAINDDQVGDYLFLLIPLDGGVSEPIFFKIYSGSADANKLRLASTAAGGVAIDVIPTASTLYFFSIVNDVSAGTIGIYVNSVYKGTLSGNLNIQDGYKFFINGYNGVFCRSTGGNYYDLAIFNYSKTPNEISTDYQNTLGSGGKHLFMYERY